MKESQIQSAVVSWWHVAHRGLNVPDARLLIMIPNGAYFGAGRNARGVPLAAIRSVQMKRQGMVSGAPDLFLAIPRGNMAAARFDCGLWIEMKTEVGRTSPVQKEMHALLRAQGYAVVTAHSFDGAVNAITAYLAGMLNEQVL